MLAPSAIVHSCHLLGQGACCAQRCFSLRGFVMFQFICTFIVLLVIVSIVWPDPRIKQRNVDRRHTETLAAIAAAARHSAAPTAPIAPTSGPAYRAHVIA